MTSPYDSPDYHALIRGIRKIDLDGGDSTINRLVTADWMEDHGEEQSAAFVRAGVHLQTIRRGLNYPHQSSRYRRAMAELVTLMPGQEPTDWVPGMRTWWGHAGGGCHCHNGETPAGGPTYAVANFGNGFVCRVAASLAFWLDHGPDLCRRHPVREVVITDAHGHIGEIVGDNPPIGYFVLRDRVPGFRHGSLWHTPALAASDLGYAALRWAEAEADTLPYTR